MTLLCTKAIEWSSSTFDCAELYAEVKLVLLYPVTFYSTWLLKHREVYH